MRYKLCTISVIFILFATSCVQLRDEQAASILSQELGITVSEARSFYENDIMSRAETECKSPNVLSPGDYTPQWDNAEMSQNSRIACVDVPIIPTYRYRAIRSEFSRGHANAYRVDVSQKLVIVKDRESGAMASYIMSLIPDKGFAAKYKGDISNIFLNANDRGRYSGIMVYTHRNFPICVSKYKDGQQLSCISLCNDLTEESVISKLNILYNEWRKIRLIKSRLITSRSESSYDYDEYENPNENESGNESENEGSQFAQSLLVEDEQGNLALYVLNEETNQYEQWHVWYAPIDCIVQIPEPDLSIDPPTGQKDPTPENGENGDNQNDGGGSSGIDSGGNTGNTNNSTYGGIIADMASKVSNIELRDLMSKNTNVLFVVNNSVDLLKINFVTETSGSNITIHIRNIQYNPQEVKYLNEKGIVMAILHEFMHPYLEVIGQSGTEAEDHQKLVKGIKDEETNETKNVYMQTIREVLPNEDDDFYDVAMYARCVNCEEFTSSPPEKRDQITDTLDYYLNK